MFGPVVPTPYDLRFSLLGIPVRVSPWFWLMSAILGWSAIELGLQFLLLWVLAVFISILVHEFGHALTARAFGYPPRVLLYQFGGLAMYTPDHKYALWKSLLTVAAGPFAGILLGGAVLILTLTLRTQKIEMTDEAAMFLSDMLYINFFWSAMNLLPVLPLDGGQMSRDLLLMVTPRRGMQFALIISAVVGAGIAIWALTSQQLYIAILFGSMAGGSIQELQRRRQMY
ncbi:MAG: site-2 protease family protein [Planctomycetaceae bacterium]|nr:site-2 protease family protein [Planctomycetaceae bacterium]